MVICHESFPAGRLLALATTTTITRPETELAAHLAHACRSPQPAVWVDCRLLDSLSATAAWLLWACQQRLRRRRALLVLYRVPAPIMHTLRRTLADTADGGLLIVPTLDEVVALTAPAGLCSCSKGQPHQFLNF